MDDNKEFKDNFNGQFKIHIDYFFCCSKIENLFMNSDKNRIGLYYDKDFQKPFIIIPINNLVAACRHQMCPKDIYTFSIFYKDENVNNGINEIKLRVSYRRDIEMWVEKFKSIIKKYKFQLRDDEIEISEYLPSFKRDPKKFYYKLNILENIICFHKSKKVIDTLKLYKAPTDLINVTDDIVNLDEIGVNFQVSYY